MTTAGSESQLAPDPGVQLSGITKSFPGCSVLRDVSLTADRGEVLWIRGASGAGKSTLLGIIGLLIRPDAGQVWLAGQRADLRSNPHAARLRARLLGFVFQHHHLLSALTAQENVLIAGHGARQSIRNRAADLLEEFAVADRGDARAEELSGGERQRVGLARALINDPPVVLADEPISGLDETAARKVLDTFSSVARSGRTVVIASHDAAVGRVADRVAYLDAGRLTTSAEEVR
ncbi:ATP-binding cassette domain-containing protein [Haloechinothrix sp. LS1_15]|uniref:ABC transporter ATP-binding protein n=1 Tax=Haloechinothrix sp. LS1_15 TaxID=2652248 RepID=UPI0029449251|nr:ATP-binding cassette domain-containing protein [Haloechinothrix sp. LS1_15]MDV6011437.1 ATP-binding cassette domain-containing protein [Haloechinothrix sp. LS1_15]